jgi:hypothetical protein
MGAVHSGIPIKLATDLKHKYGLTAFVESGLAQGTSALWAERLFDTVISIEIDGNSVATFKARYPKSKVMVIEGDSAIEMADVAISLNKSALFWLDGHTDDCTPIMDELAAINSSALPHVVMIDDWRMFGTCPAWPSKADVMDLATNGKRWAYDVDDVLVAEPVVRGDVIIGDVTPKWSRGIQ